ncbi:hypothetical protein Dda_5171 [Drechslerella dactyloides]|uniref:Uncharacterized protein n=1 Tax=Drechslerella dactyloides TaxID=74499 RepID=A0AAD6IX21_DREDA|nr:hypothetical protein Dda_5171 [Drechslerella dactyloides]
MFGLSGATAPPRRRPLSLWDSLCTPFQDNSPVPIPRRTGVWTPSSINTDDDIDININIEVPSRENTPTEPDIDIDTDGNTPTGETTPIEHESPPAEFPASAVGHERLEFLADWFEEITTDVYEARTLIRERAALETWVSDQAIDILTKLKVEHDKIRGYIANRIVKNNLPEFVRRPGEECEFWTDCLPAHLVDRKAEAVVYFERLLKRGLQSSRVLSLTSSAGRVRFCFCMKFPEMAA